MGKAAQGSVSTLKLKSEGHDDEIKREKRRAANRRSARKSRYRELVMLDELQRNAGGLSAQNSALRQENESLRNLISTMRKFKKEEQKAASAVREYASGARFSFMNCDTNFLLLQNSNFVIADSRLELLPHASLCKHPRRQPNSFI